MNKEEETPNSKKKPLELFQDNFYSISEGPYSNNNFYYHIMMEIENCSKSVPVLFYFKIPLDLINEIKLFDLYGLLNQLSEEKSVIFLKEEFSELVFCINALEIQYHFEIKKVLRNLACNKFQSIEEVENNEEEKIYEKNESSYLKPKLNNRLEVPSFAKSDDLFSFENQVQKSNKIISRVNSLITCSLI